MENKIKLLNALPLNALPPAAKVTMEIEEIVDPMDLRRIVANMKIESFIGHASTAKALQELLGQEVGVNRAEATLQRGDTVIVVVLKRRIQGDVDVNLADLRFFLVKIK